MTQPKKKLKAGNTKKKFEKKAPVEGEGVKEEKKDIDEHPLANGHFLVVKYRDGSDRLVRVSAELDKALHRITLPSMALKFLTDIDMNFFAFIAFVDSAFTPSFNNVSHVMPSVICRLSIVTVKSKTTTSGITFTMKTSTDAWMSGSPSTESRSSLLRVIDWKKRRRKRMRSTRYSMKGTPAPLPSWSSETLLYARGRGQRAAPL